MKNVVFWDLRRVALVGADVSEECSASIITVTRISELETMFVRFEVFTAVTMKW
jgi:hypothetical protein